MDAEELAIVALIVALAFVSYEDANGHMMKNNVFLQAPSGNVEKASIREVGAVPPGQRD